SVRKAGDRVRITAQLIRADNGAHLWAETYDRRLTDIFAAQEDIAKAIAGALKVPLGLPQGELLVGNRTDSFETYQQYLRARSLLRARAIDEAAAILEPTVARDPNFAPAWALLAQVYRLSMGNQPGGRGASIEDALHASLSGLDRIEMATREAVRLDPKHA